MMHTADGTRVVLKGDHAWAGFSGVVVGRGSNSVGYYLKVELDDGEIVCAFAGQFKRQGAGSDVRE
jgi:hypothetical protein